jgi:phage gp36-like protein
MGLMKKLLGLVVEFPEDHEGRQAAKPEKKTSESDDVVAAIEQIRKDLEGEQTSALKSSLAEPVAKDKPHLPPVASQSSPSDKPSGTATATSAASAPGIQPLVVLEIPQVYAKAKIENAPDGFNVYKVEQMFADPDIADLPVEIRARSVNMALRTMGQDVKSLLLDAGKRDQVLDAYEQVLNQQAEDISRKVQEANASLQQEVDSFVTARKASMEQNLRVLEQTRKELARYQQERQAEEQRLFNIVAPFVAPGENPVGLTAQDNPTKPDHPKR